MRWELYCRVIDNHGDLGVCWRLARQLGERGDRVRLWVDRPDALRWMAPSGAAGVDVRAWTEDEVDDLGDVVVEAFGCEPPAAARRAMWRARPRPAWINLEYLSAQAYVERSHALPSPQADGLTRWFFYPGFTPRTGGLLRADPPPEGGRAWLAARGWAPADDERVISLFAYPHLLLTDWLPWLASPPTLLLTAPGPVAAALRGRPLPPGLRHIAVPWLPQADHDQLLRSCDLNAVRGEDSFAQAHDAGRPLLWHIYPQDDGAHVPKLEAWLDRLLEGSDASTAAAVRGLQRAWNGLAPPPAQTLQDADRQGWSAAHGRLRARLRERPDLATALRRFALDRLGKP